MIVDICYGPLLARKPTFRSAPISEINRRRNDIAVPSFISSGAPTGMYIPKSCDHTGLIPNFDRAVDDNVKVIRSGGAEPTTKGGVAAQ